MKLLSHVRLLVTPRTAAYQAPPSMGFSRQEYRSGVPLPSPEFMPNPRLISMARSMQPIHGQFWRKPSSILSQLLWPRILNHVKRMAATIWVTCLELDGRRSGSPKKGRIEAAQTGPLGHLCKPSCHPKLSFSISVYIFPFTKFMMEQSNVR